MPSSPDVQRVKLSWLRPSNYNPRKRLKPGDTEYEALKRSIVEFGHVQVIVANKDGTVIGGHQTLAVLRRLGWKECNAVVLDLDEAHEKALNLALNRIGGDWDEPKLQAVVADLQLAGIDLAMTGFSLDDPELGKREVAEDDGGPALDSVTARCKRGEVWMLGKHRLMCGDATSEKDHTKLLDGAKPAAVVTDPPYGVGAAYESFKDDAAAVRTLIEKFMPLVLRHPVAVLTSGHRCMWDYPRPAWVMVWVHPAGMGCGPWGFNLCNPILCYGNDPYLKAGKGSRPDTLVLATDREGEEGHPTPKPIKVWAWLVERVTPKPDALVFDPFIGSGTTIIACEQLGRVCYGMEIEPRYCEVAMQRWEKMTGKKAVRA